MKDLDKMPERADTRFWAQFELMLIPATDACWPLVDPNNWVSDYSADGAVAYFDAHPDAPLHAVVPDGHVAFHATSFGEIELQKAKLREFNVPPGLWCDTGHGAKIALYKLDPDLSAADVQGALGAELTVISEGGIMPLPSGQFFQPDKVHAKHLSALEMLSLDTGDKEVPADPVMIGTPLERHSLRGKAQEFEERARNTVPLFGRAILMSQITALFAAPNTGKTLILLHLLMDAISKRRVHAANCYYINADDSSSGVAEKLRLLQDLGAHTLVPGYAGFQARNLATLLTDMVRLDRCSGVVVIIDTMKAFTDLMNKTDAREFGIVARQVGLHGGTIVEVAHINKNSTAKGKPIHSGTSDLVEDADAACFLITVEDRSEDDEKIVQFEFFKRRGHNVNETYAYTARDEASYAERLVSVRLVDPTDAEGYCEAAIKRSDADMIAAVTHCICAGVVQKMALATATAKRARCSKRQAIELIERYTGTDPAQHHWDYSVHERGAKVYSLLAGEAQPPG